MSQCTATAKSTGRQCRRGALAGANVCSKHGGSAGQVKAAAARRVAERKARVAVDAEIAKTGRTVTAGQDPLTVLEDALSDVVAVKERLGAIVARMADPELRYRGRAGEQLRGELAAYMSCLRDVTRTAGVMIKLGIAERRAAVDERISFALFSVIRDSLDRLNLSAEQKALAGQVVPEELRLMQARLAAGTESRPPLPPGSKRPAV